MTVSEQSDDYAQLIDGSTLVLQRWLPGPIERVWRYLTDSDLRQKWLAAGEMVLVPGTPVEFVWRNDNLSDADDPRPEGFSDEERMQSRVIAVDPMKLFTIAWGDGDVTFELKEKGEKVRLTITHRGLTNPSTRSKIASGWHMHTDILVAVVANIAVPTFWSGWTKLNEAYIQRLPE